MCSSDLFPSHDIRGVLLLAITIPWVVSYLLRPKKSKFVKFTFWSYISIISVLMFTGIVLHMGNWIDVDYDFRENCRDVHYWFWFVCIILGY